MGNLLTGTPLYELIAKYWLVTGMKCKYNHAFIAQGHCLVRRTDGRAHSQGCHVMHLPFRSSQFQILAEQVTIYFSTR